MAECRRHCSHPNHPLAQEGGRRLWEASLTLGLQEAPLPFPGAEVWALPLPLHHPSLPQLLWDVPKGLQLCTGACDLSLAAVLGWEGPGHPKMPLLGVL